MAAVRLPTKDRFDTGALDLSGAPPPASISGTRRLVIWAAIALAVIGVGFIVYTAHQRDAADMREIVRQAALEEGIDPRLAEAVVHVESGGNPRARSRAGALGLMQLMPGTARDMAGRAVTEPELFDPRFNARLGCRYLRYLLRAHDGDLLLALMAYNAGIGNVRRWREKDPDATPRYMLDRYGFRETRVYVAKIIEYLKARASPAEG